MKTLVKVLQYVNILALLTSVAFLIHFALSTDQQDVRYTEPSEQQLLLEEIDSMAKEIRDNMITKEDLDSMLTKEYLDSKLSAIK